jgi:hypothetical protein
MPKNLPGHRFKPIMHAMVRDNTGNNVRGEPVFSVMVAGWFCGKSGWIGKVEDVKPVLLKTKLISTNNHFEEEDFYPDGFVK